MQLNRQRTFASDNYAGVCPEAMAELVRANSHQAMAYGADPFTATACDALRELFQTECEIFFTFNGTAGNSLALAALCRSYHAVICHELAHVETDECGAPEFYSGGSKLLLVGGEQGKVRPAGVEDCVHRRNDLHYPKPKVLSITQATEVGTVYTEAEVSALGALTHGLGLKLHMDGARFANAVAHLGCAPKDITWRAGVDVLTLGGTKNGLAVGEAVVFFDRKAAFEFEYRCKQSGQLASKMRFLSAPWLGLLRGQTWLKNARHANAMAQKLADGLDGLPNAEILFPRQANSVFASLTPETDAHMKERGWVYYNFIGAGGARLMCAWDTREEDVEAFLQDMREAPDAR
jgi:threonine aldolase